MKCTKPMLITGAALLSAAVLAYAALPQARALIESVGPFLLFLLCPLSMMLMMKGMHSKADHEQPASETGQTRLLTQESKQKN